ncbi:dihydrofolate reductase [Murinocardiopsis flavida]|uniref:Dihydrofolate reductase n=1 Tax=Murinocardiopsis flavida TaxID=645275 RepID=A0A2P8CZ15_9ACTN|nr:dihydrofolate reductase family protein [Murinocardiopsis flavida]PSK90211.1 dihydrofolate reductase [Murinocardiopsis flavida]
MRRVIATTLMSLDGVIDHPEQWAFDSMSEQVQQANYDQLFASDALLLGRETYVGFAETWPSMRDDEAGFGERMNSITTYVVSTTLEKAEWNNATIISENVAEEVAKLKELPGEDILIYGVGRLAYSLLDAGVLDELRIWVHPVLFGSATTEGMITREGPKTALELAGTRTLDTGIVIHTYTPKKPA